MEISKKNINQIILKIINDDYNKGRSSTWSLKVQHLKHKQLLIEKIPFFYHTSMIHQLVSFPTNVDVHLNRDFRNFKSLSDHHTFFERLQYLFRLIKPLIRFVIRGEKNYTPNHNLTVNFFYRELINGNVKINLDDLPPAHHHGSLTYDFIDNRFINGQMLKFLFQYSSIKRHKPLINLLKSNEASILEIGAGFGGFCHTILHNHRVNKYTIIDLPETIILSIYMLKNLFPEIPFHYHCSSSGNNIALKEGINFIPFNNASNLKNNKFDLIINSESLLEMDKESIDFYFKLIQLKNKSKYFYNYNREFRVEGNVKHSYKNLPYSDSWIDIFNEKLNFISTNLYSPIIQSLKKNKSF